jgi:hypothetical protein
MRGRLFHERDTLRHVRRAARSLAHAKPVCLDETAFRFIRLKQNEPGLHRHAIRHEERDRFLSVERELIQPAIEAVGFSGGTTGEIIKQGNIRTDMFQKLLVADLVIADISIHNANAFYELGARHAFREKRSFSDPVQQGESAR